jgi:hydroxymethylpyrimidine/phosphomethylpyrimidine kinase
MTRIVRAGCGFCNPGPGAILFPPGAALLAPPGGWHVRPIVLSIAGSDSSSGAGIQADLKTIDACGGWGATAITALTAQNTIGVRGVTAIDPAVVRGQIEAVLDDLDVAAIKTGMLGSAGVVAAVATALAAAGRPYVCDPVLRSSSGTALLDDPGITALRAALVPLATVVTPNADEAEVLTGLRVRTAEDAHRAGEKLLALGASAALVTGGHLEGDRVVDVLVERASVTRFAGPRIATAATHGTGCVLSAAIATHLARGRPLAEAVGLAKRFVERALESAVVPGRGRGAVDPLHVLHEREGAR